MAKKKKLFYIMLPFILFLNFCKEPIQNNGIRAITSQTIEDAVSQASESEVFTYFLLQYIFTIIVNNASSNGSDFIDENGRISKMRNLKNIYNMSNSNYINSYISMKDIESCVEIHSSLDNPSVTIDYGNGCLLDDTFFFEGRIILTVTNLIKNGFLPLREDSNFLVFSFTFSFENFSVNRNQVEMMGNISIFIPPIQTNTTLLPSIQHSLIEEISLKKGSITFRDGKSIMIKGNWINHLEYSDSQVQIHRTGNIDGTVLGNINYQSSISESLFFTSECINQGMNIFPVSGIVNFSFENNSQRVSINYGEINCDNKATLTIEEESREIILPDASRWFMKR